MVQISKKKKGFMIAGGVVGLAILLTGGWFAYSASRYKISAEEAQAIALKNAGVTDSDLIFSQVEKDSDDMKATYEVSFNTAEGEYDYTIDAETGSILDRDYEVVGTVASSNNAVAVADTTTSSNAVSSAVVTPTMTETQAKEIALKDAGVAETAVVNLLVQLDVENGKQYYEVDFNDPKAGLDYSYTIDAETGAIVEKSKEPIND
ncbi:PepSY domain-containing protein [Streptococcus ovis]|uniref:PepSY domain-containing protein n=1 Tax=Streptococcus ovis TaxID=82806 RepID=UPI00035F4AF9|nr:PepSY domain-containing protein [Streptococcus ovis]